MPSTYAASIDMVPSTSALDPSALSATYHYNNTILLPSLEQRLHTPPAAPLAAGAFSASASASASAAASAPAAPAAAASASGSYPSAISASPSSASLLGPEINSSTGLTSISHIASVVVSNFLPLTSASAVASSGDDSASADDTKYAAASPYTAAALTASSTPLAASASAAFRPPSYSSPVVESLVASSAEDFSNNFRDLSFDVFDDNDQDLFGSPMAFDASENGLWNGRFVPPPPRPPFFVDEPVLSDGLTTCDLCSWAMPTKSTFIFEGTMEKASELGWPLTLTIVSIFSAILGAIIMIAVVKCRRKKTSHQRSDTHVQWWSRNKRPNGNNNHLRRSNIYTAHPVDSIRGLQQPSSLSASSSMTAMTTAMAVGAAPVAASAASAAAATLPFYHHHHGQHSAHLHGHGTVNLHHHHHPQLPHEQYLQQQQHHFEHEHEYHQPQELHLQHQQQQQPPPPPPPASLFHNHNHSLHSHPSQAHLHAHAPLQLQHQHQHQLSAASMSSTSTASMPSLSCMMPLQRQLPEPMHLPTTISGSAAMASQAQRQRQQADPEQERGAQSPDLHHDSLFHWPTATSIVTS